MVWRMVKAEKGGLLHDSGHAIGRGRVSTQPIQSSSGTRVIDLNRQRFGDRGQKVFMNSSSHRCGLAGHYPSLIWSQAGGPPKEGLLSGVVSVPCHNIAICLSWNPRWLQSYCKQNDLEQNQIQNRGRDAKLLQFFLHSWVQDGVSAFQQKQFEYLLHLYYSFLFLGGGVGVGLGFLSFILQEDDSLCCPGWPQTQSSCLHTNENKTFWWQAIIFILGPASLSLTPRETGQHHLPWWLHLTEGASGPKEFRKVVKL
jgi:hypothetical protein